MEQARSLAGDVPEELAVSVVTVGELRHGVLSAADPGARAIRLRTLAHVMEFDPITITRSVAAAWAELTAALRRDGLRMPVNDSWIAATALSHQLPIVSQDSDYDAVRGLTVIHL